MKRLGLILLIMIPVLGFSQSSDLGNWFVYIGNKKIDDKINWHHEAQYRNYNAIGDLEQLLLRTGIGYDLTENNNNLLLGYGYILSQNYVNNTDEKISINEHRIYQQFVTKQSFGRVNFQHRYRFEQRFIEEEDLKLRFRYFLGLNIALNKKQFEDQTIYFSGYNEIFLNSEKDVFDRNRLFGGLGYMLNKNTRFEVGYMNQFLNNGNRDQINLVAFFNF